MVEGQVGQGARQLFVSACCVDQNDLKRRKEMIKVRLFRGQHGVNDPLSNHKRLGVFTKEFNDVDDLVKYLACARFVYGYDLKSDLTKEQFHTFAMKYRAVMYDSKLLKNCRAHHHVLKAIRKRMKDDKYGFWETEYKMLTQ